MSNIRENLGLSSTNNATPNTNSNIRKNLGITSNSGSSIRSNLGLNNYKSNTKVTTPVASKEKVNGKITLANLSDVTLGGSKFLDDGYQLGDASKTLLSSIGSAANYLGQGVLKGAEGIFDAAYNLGTSNLNPYYWFNQDKLKEHQEIAKEVTQKNAVEELMKTVTKDNNFKLSEFNNKVLDPYSIVKSDNIAGQVVQGVGQMLPSIALGNPTVGTGMIGASSYGSGVEEAYNNGATHNQAKLYGLGNAATEIATEWLTGGIPGIKSSGGIDKYVAKGLGLKSIDEVSKSLSKEIIKAGYKVVGEGAEEALSEIINPFLKQFTYEHNNDKGFTGNIKEAISKEDLSKIINSAIVGAITGGILEAPINISSIKASKKLYQNNMHNSSLYSANSNTTPFSNINSQNNNNAQNNVLNLPNIGMYQYNKESNEKINSLKESAKNYFDNSEETHNYLDTISKIISDKNYNITFNDKIVDKMGVINPNINGKISTGLDGNISIEVNPKSSKAGEFIIMHEITHAIENREMKSLVLDYASKNQEFNTALNSLKETYRTNDVSSEVLADISGQLFGNQEFINNLSMKKPNVFKSIYNKIIEIANKITGNSKETLFIKDLKAKWENAYRTQNSKLIETDYSKGKLLNGEDVVISDDNNGTHANKDDAKKSLNSMLGINYLNGSNNVNLRIENKDIKKFLNDGYNNYKSNDLKRRIVGNYGEILELAKIDSNASQSNYKSSNRGILGYDYYNINLAYPVKDSLGNILNYKYYEARLVVRKESNGDFAYDLDKFTQKKGTVLDKINLSIAADKSARGSFSANNISQSGTDVKSNISTKYSMLESENNTQDQNSYSLSLQKKYSNINLNEDISNMDGVPAIQLNDDSIIPIKNGEPHIPFIQKSNIDINDIKNGGWITNGEYEGSYRSDTNRYVEQQKAHERVKVKRTIINNKQRQLDIINKTNPVNDEYHTWIRNVSDIKTFEESLQDDDWKGWEETGFDPDYDANVVNEALNTGKITVYSSYPIKQGIFVSPSKMEAESYSGTGKVYSKEVNLSDIAWIDPTQGQYANINDKYSKKSNSNWEKHLDKNYKQSGTTTNMKEIEFPPVFNNKNSTKNEKFVSLPVKYDEEFLNHKIKEYQEIDTSKMSNESKEIITEELNKYKKELLKLKGVNGDPTKETTYNSDKEISDLDIKKQRKSKIKEYKELASLYTKDMTQWKDKGLASQKINTMKRNLMDIMPQKQAENIYEEYFVPIRENNAIIEKEINKYNDKIKSLKLNQKESTAVQMLGEYKYNPETLVTGMQVEKYISDNKLDYNKISASVEKFRSIYDELFGKVNDVLIEQGYSKIEYKKGYFPHFIDEKGNNILQKFASKLGWKFNDQKLPTDIAGLTDMFLPGKKWTSFSQHRTGKITDYNALKGFDNYIRGAMDVIYHTEDIQKLRGLESQIRYQHSEKGLQERIDQIVENDTISQEQKEELVDKEYQNAANPLSNFVTNLRDYTNGIPGKKSSLDRSMEQFVGRKWYNTMDNIQSRLSANMVAMNISSALTNFIPITQAWSQISTKNMFKAINQSISSNFTNDTFENSSIYLTNRLNKADKLSKTILDKTADKAGFLFEAVDSFTSNVIVRGKYLENIDKGMPHDKALKNADEFANDVMAGRSKGDMPTIFNSRNFIVKAFTAFQLEVSNQYGYMFKDLPKDLKDEGIAKLVMAFLKMFLGAWLYNKVNESLTGRKSAFSPIDIISKIIETTSNDNLSSFDKLSKTSENLVQQLPYVGGLLGGGRLPISSALPSLSTVTENTVNLGDNSKRKTAIENLKKELMKPVFYVVMPFGGGQLKKTLEGASMYSHDIPGSYTSSGDLRFSVGTDSLSKAQALVFGQYSSKNARDYFDNNSSALNDKQMSEYKDLGLPISEYRDIKSGLSKLKKTEDKIDYITGLPISKLQKNIILNNNLTNNSYVDVEDYKNYSSYDEYVFAKNSEDKYSVIKNFNIPYSNYNNYVDNIDYIKKQYSETDERKAAVYNYINSQSISIVQKVAMFKLAGYSIKSYQDSMFNYINNLKLSKSEKEQIWKYLYS